MMNIESTYFFAWFLFSINSDYLNFDLFILLLCLLEITAQSLMFLMLLVLKLKLLLVLIFMLLFFKKANEILLVMSHSEWNSYYNIYRLWNDIILLAGSFLLKKELYLGNDLFKLATVSFLTFYLILFIFLIGLLLIEMCNVLDDFLWLRFALALIAGR